MQRILIIDDEEKLRTLLTRIISLEGFDVLEAADAKSALKKLEQSEIDVILCDVKLPDGNGIELSKTIKSKYPLSEIILLTAYGNIPDGVQAIKNGAFDYIVKGDDNNKIVPLLYRAFDKVALARRVQHLEKQLGEKQSFDTLIGKSKSFLSAIELAKKVAPTDATVLLSGETGVGKELFAQAIHHASHRNKKNFVAINCSAYSKDLLENEMFGHTIGAFTGAVKETKGIFQEAHEGTLFLDEIGEMPLELQAKLLRILETGAFHKVGDSKTTQVNVRIVAASNRDLNQEAERGQFRKDLFYRISGFEVKLPPLRERIIDIETLATHFARVFALKSDARLKSITPEFIQALKNHPWPGNIRELKNVIERSVIMMEDGTLTVNTLPVEFQTEPTNSTQGKQLSAFELASAEKLHIQKVMNHTNHNKTEAARLLNIAITTLYRKLDEYKIS